MNITAAIEQLRHHFRVRFGASPTVIYLGVSEYRNFREQVHPYSEDISLRWQGIQVEEVAVLAHHLGAGIAFPTPLPARSISPFPVDTPTA